MSGEVSADLCAVPLNGRYCFDCLINDERLLLGGKGSITFLDKRHVWTIQLREATAEDADKIPAFERAITERTGEVVLAEQEQWKREEAEGRHE